MFKYRDYSKNKKGGGSREPLPFVDKDPLFYLSSFQIPFREEPAAKSSGLFLCNKRLPQIAAAFWRLWNEIFEDGKPALFDGSIIIFSAADCPADTLHTVEFAANQGAQVFPVCKFVGGEVRHGEKVGQAVGQCKFQGGGHGGAGLEVVVTNQTGVDIVMGVEHMLTECLTGGQSDHGGTLDTRADTEGAHTHVGSTTGGVTLLENEGLQTVLSGGSSGGQTGQTGCDDDDISFHLLHDSILLKKYFLNMLQMR